MDVKSFITLGPGVNVIKLFFLVTDEEAKYYTAFELDKSNIFE
jgi:hypothetical protein